MNKRNERIANFYERMRRIGIEKHDDIEALRRIEMTLSRWGERECNGEVERDEKTGKTLAIFDRQDFATGQWRRDSYPVPDKETGALKRLRAIMSKYPALWYYHQADPRGCSLYVGRWADIGQRREAPRLMGVRELAEISAYYTRGVAVCY